MAERRGLLRSWKEISAHLGVDERTCARWEQRFNLPVHRAAEGAGRSHVFAYADELDSWFKQTFTASNWNGEPAANMGALGRPTADVPGNFSLPKIGNGAFVVACLALITVGLAFLALRGPWQLGRSPGQPNDFHLRGSVLIIYDADQQELWRREIGVDGLRPEEWYRDYFQVAASGTPGLNLPMIVMRDIDGDGNREVLFAIKKVSDSYGEGSLICFEADGNERWRFKAGREINYGGRALSRDYRIHGFICHDLDKDGREEICILSYYYPFEPCQLSILDCQNKPRGEFWNAGQLSDIAFYDFDGDGQEELVAAGTYNEFGGGCLVAFDPSAVQGASPRGDPLYRFDGIPEGSEKVYIRFAGSDVQLASGIPIPGIHRLDVTSGKDLQVVSAAGLIYIFGGSLYCTTCRPETGYVMKHRELVALGKIISVLNDTYFETLRESIRFWNGSIWVREPSIARREKVR